MIARFRLAGRFPNPADGPTPQTNDPCPDHQAEHVKGFLAERDRERLYQNHEGRDKLIHRRASLPYQVLRASLQLPKSTRWDASRPAQFLAKPYHKSVKA